MSAIQNLKQQFKLQGFLISDPKGFQIYNNGFTNSHHVHALKQLSKYFFPEEEGTIVGIETNDYTIVIKDSTEGNMVAIKQLK